MKAIRYLLGLLLCISTSDAVAEEPKIGSPEGLGKAIEAGFKEGDLAIFERVLDVDALVDRCLRNLPGSDKEKQDFRTGFRKGFTINSSLRKGIEAAEDYKFLRVRKIGTNDTLLFRLIAPADSGVNYHEHLLERRAGGELAIVDIHIFMMGELLSRTVRRIALGALAQQPGFLDRLLGHEADIVRYGKEIQSLSQLTQKREYQKVLATVRKLPESLQNQKFVMVHKLAAASQVDEKEYALTISQWEKLFPRDPSLPLVSVDGYILRKDYDTAIKMLDTLNSSIGGDPYLLVLEAGQYNLKGDKTKARTTAEQALKAEPTLAPAVDFLLSVNLEEKRFADVSKLLLDFEKVSGANMAEAIKDEEAYAEFRSSDEYKKFLSARQKPGGQTKKRSTE